MKKQKSKLSAKLKSSTGESLAEVLIALLIAALALTMLASVISTTSRILTKSHQTMEDYYDANDAVAGQTGTAIPDFKIKMTLKAPGTGEGNYPAGEEFLSGGLSNAGAGFSGGQRVSVGLYVNNVAGDSRKVISYKKAG